MIPTRYLRRRKLSSRHSKLAAIFEVAVFLFVAPLLFAHHGLAAFDTTHTVKMSGVVTDFQFINPHSYIFADLTDDKGKTANWKCEMGSLGMLTRHGGWTPDTVKKGDQVTIQGFVAKDGSPYMSLGKIILSDGRTLLGAP